MSPELMLKTFRNGDSMAVKDVPEVCFWKQTFAQASIF